MTKIDDGGSAFPMPSGPEPRHNETTHYNEGMTLRQWYAGMAMSGLLANLSFVVPTNRAHSELPGIVAKAALMVADALITAEKGGGE